MTDLQTWEKHSSPPINLIAADYRTTTQETLDNLQTKLLRYQSRSTGSAGYPVNLLASTRLRRRSNGKPCMVCSIGTALAAIVVFAYAFWLEATAGGFSIFFSSSHLKQMEIQRSCARAWERRCWHPGSLTTTSAGLTSRDGVVSWLLSAGAF